MDKKIRLSQKYLGKLVLSYIPINYNLLKDTNIQNKDLKAKIYSIALKIILDHIYLSLSFIDFKKIKKLLYYGIA